MIFTDEHKRMVINWARWKALVSLGVVAEDDFDIVPDADTIIAYSRSHKACLEDLIQAYETWHAYHKYLDAENKAGSLSAQEQAYLQTLIDSRDVAKAAFVAVL